MAPPTPSPSFEIRLVGKNIKPSSVPFSTLAKVLEAVNQLIADQTGGQSDSESPEQLHLLGVRPGSARYAVFADQQDRAIKSLKLTGKVIANPEDVETAEHVLNPLDTLSQVAKQAECIIEFVLPGKDGDVLARIVPTTFQAISKTAFVRGETSIEGKIERVGGATRLHCGLHVRGHRKMVICSVASRDVARQIGQHLYEHAIFEGSAVWYRRTWKLRRFAIKSMHQIERRSVASRFAELRKAVGDSWNHIDPDCIDRMRGND